MNSLKNYIFLSICEKSLELFKDSLSQTYFGFCNTIKSSMELGQLGKYQLFIIYEITDYLRLIYNLTDEECNEYIADFFLVQKFLLFEKPVKLTLEHFKNSFN